MLLLGDSLTAGYGLPQGQAFPVRLEAALRGRGLEVTVLDGGVSGDTTAGGLARVDWALADRPSHAVVELGANDALRESTLRSPATISIGYCLACVGPA